MKPTTWADVAKNDRRYIVDEIRYAFEDWKNLDPGEITRAEAAAIKRDFRLAIAELNRFDVCTYCGKRCKTPLPGLRHDNTGGWHGPMSSLMRIGQHHEVDRKAARTHRPRGEGTGK